MARAAAGLFVWALACGCEPSRDPAPAPAPEAAGLPVPPATSPRDVAVIEVEGFGEIRFELLADVAPATVANFVKLAEQGFYDGTTFHRVIPGFMIQGGDPYSRDRDPRNDGYGGAAAKIADELSALNHARGIVSMANSGKPNSASSQFFIVLVDRPDLNGGYSAFGHVISGMDVADRIVAVPRDVYGRHGPLDRPLENVVMKSVRIERAISSQSEDSPPSAVAPAETRG